MFFMLVYAFFISIFKYHNKAFSDLNFGQLGFNFLLVIVSLFTITFIVKKNALTKDNNFTSFFFALYFLLIPQLFLNTTVLLAHFLILLAFRRLISLYTQRNTIGKLFKSGFFIACASLLYSWSISYLVLAFIAVNYLQEKKLKYFLVVLVGLFSVIILTITTHLFYPNLIEFHLDFGQKSFNFNLYDSFQLISAVTLILVLALWTTIPFVSRIAKQKRILRPAFRLVVAFLMISTFINVISIEKTSAELLFFVLPLVITCTNYFQREKDKIFKEIILGLWILLIILTHFI